MGVPDTTCLTPFNFRVAVFVSNVEVVRLFSTADLQGATLLIIAIPVNEAGTVVSGECEDFDAVGDHDLIGEGDE